MRRKRETDGGGSCRTLKKTTWKSSTVRREVRYRYFPSLRVLYTDLWCTYRVPLWWSHIGGNTERYRNREIDKVVPFRRGCKFWDWMSFLSFILSKVGGIVRAWRSPCLRITDQRDSCRKIYLGLARTPYSKILIRLDSLAVVVPICPWYGFLPTISTFLQSYPSLPQQELTQ